MFVQVDDIMMMDTATITRQHDIVYQHGTLHQGDESFSAHSCGCQCVPYSIASIALSKFCTILRWTTEDLDLILRHGDKLYKNIRPEEYFNQHPGDSGLLVIEDIPTEFNVFGRHFKISCDGCEDCLINCTDIIESLQKFCQHSEHCDGLVFMGNQCGAYASSLIYRNGRVYTFDPHSLSPITGMPCANGTSVLLSFDSIFKFAEYLLHCASNRNAEQLTLWKVIITKMQQLEYRDPKLKNGEHQSVNLKLHIGKLQSNTVHNKMKDDHMKNLANTKCSQDTESERIEHSQQIESERNVALMCDICSKTLNNLYNFNLHKQICKEKQTFICKKCSKKLDNSHNLKSHQEACKGKQTFICKKCSKELDNSHNLKSHQEACKGKQTFTCKKCSKELDNSHNLKSHQEACKGKQTFICKKCSKELDNSHNLKSHQVACKGKQIFICKICSKNLGNSYNLNEHETKCKKK